MHITVCASAPVSSASPACALAQRMLWGLAASWVLVFAAPGQVGVPFCGASANSTGEAAVLRGEGARGVLENRLVLRCERLPRGSFGHFLVADEVGLVSQPAGAVGDLCLGGTLGRFRERVLCADAAGVVRMPVDLFDLPGAAAGLTPRPGQLRRFQYWYRDADPIAGAVSNFSAGLEVRFSRCTPRLGAATIALEIEPSQIHSADFDGDGRLDLVALADGPQSRVSVQVALNRGDGTFQTLPPIVTDGRSLLAAKLGDMDGDGAPDLAVVCAQPTRLVLLRNTGAGVLEPQAAVFDAADPRAVELADLDGDGRLDLVLTDGQSGTVDLHIQVAPWVFAPLGSVAAGNRPDALALGDVDGDGRDDVVVANVLDGTLSVLRGLEGGFFAPSATLATGMRPTGLSLADLDQDGDPDLVFLAGPEAARRVTVIENLGASNFAAPQELSLVGPGAGLRPVALAIGDLDRDGRADLSVSSQSVQSGPGTTALAVYLGQGGGAFATPLLSAPGEGALVHTVVDLDGDGSLEVVLAGQSARALYVAQHLGDGQLDLAQLSPLGSRPVRMATADFDRDGLMDLAVTDVVDGAVTVYSGRSGGHWALREVLAPVAYAALVAAGDMDGDGFADLVVTSASPARVLVYLQSPAGGFQLQSQQSAPSAATALTLADLDGDGSLDVLLADFNSDNLLTYRNLGGGQLAPWVSYPSTVLIHALVADDFNADGALDVLAFAGFFSSSSYLHLGDGAGGFSAPSILPSSQATYAAAYGDLDGDGQPDVLLGQHAGLGTTLAVRYNQGAGSFGPEVPLPGPTQSLRSLALSDIDGDGLLDIVSAAYEAAWVQFALQGGGFTEPKPIHRGRRITDLSAKDFDGDGAPDVLLLDSTGTALTLHRGRCR